MTDNFKHMGCEFLEQADVSKSRKIFTSHNWSEENRMMEEMIRDFCEKEIIEPNLKRGAELQVGNPNDKEQVVAQFKKAGELGLCGVSIPENYGGSGLDFKSNMFISEQLALSGSLGTSLGAQTSLACLPILYFGNEEQKTKYLPLLATGEWIGAYALSEPDSGSDANAAKTKATVSEDGKHYILNGQKAWISNGGFADMIIVFAKIGEDANLSAFIVEKDAVGLSIGEEEKKMGIKGSSTVQLFFQDCKVPIENLLGKRNEGFKIALNILNTGRFKIGSGGVGGAKYVLTKAIQYGNERMQFGKKLVEFGAIKEKIADIASRIFACDAALYRTADLIDQRSEKLSKQGVDPHDAKVQSIREYMMEASVIKVFGAELACDAADEAIQIFGGMGYVFETGMEMNYRDSRILRIYEGTNEINRLLAVGELLKRVGDKTGPNLRKVGKGIPSFLFSTYNPFATKTVEKNIQALKYTFIMLVGLVVKKYKKELIEQQEILSALSDILAFAYFAESAYLKVIQSEKDQAVSNEQSNLERLLMLKYLYDVSLETKAKAQTIVSSISTQSKAKKYRSAIDRMLHTGAFVNPIELERKIADTLTDRNGY